MALHDDPVSRTQRFIPRSTDNEAIGEAEEMAIRIPELSFCRWEQQVNAARACLKQRVDERWSEGFQCPTCGHDQVHYTASRGHYECAAFDGRSSVALGTLFHATKLPLVTWFWAVYWVASDKGSISALRLSKLIGVTRRSAFGLLRKLRTAMGHQDALYRLPRSSNSMTPSSAGSAPGRSAAGKTWVLIACENQEGKKAWPTSPSAASGPSSRCGATRWEPSMG